jgi:hypothetical protein
MPESPQDRSVRRSRAGGLSGFPVVRRGENFGTPRVILDLMLGM